MLSQPIILAWYTQLTFSFVRWVSFPDVYLCVPHSLVLRYPPYTSVWNFILGLNLTFQLGGLSSFLILDIRSFLLLVLSDVCCTKSSNIAELPWTFQAKIHASRQTQKSVQDIQKRMRLMVTYFGFLSHFWCLSSYFELRQFYPCMYSKLLSEDAWQDPKNNHSLSIKRPVYSEINWTDKLKPFI